jgi:hypothetical protein
MAFRMKSEIFKVPRRLGNDFFLATERAADKGAA